MTAGDRALSVGGDAIGQFSTGDHNVLVTANASLVQVHQAAPRVKPQRRAHIERLPNGAATPLGRDDEAALVLRSIADNEPVQVYGADGIGKSTLIRHAALELDGRDGVVFLDGYGKDLDDLLQAVFEACYDSPGYRPSEGELHALLADIRLCLVVDDFDEPSRHLVQLRDAIPAGTVLVASGERTLWGHGKALELAGLPKSAAQQLFARELRRELCPADEIGASLLWEACLGHPFKLLRAAALARRDTSTGLTQLPTPAEVPELLHGLITSATGVERGILGLLSVAPAAEVSIDLLAVLLAPSETAEAVRMTAERLAAFGLLTHADEKVRLFPDVAEAFPADSGQDTVRLAEITDRMTAWATARDTSAAAVAEHGPLIAAWIEAAGRSGRPDLGVKLAQAAAPATACSLRWGAWGRILTRGLTAAEQAGDERARAYFTHETGIRSLLTGKRIAAAAALTAAAAAWRSLGDNGSADIAEHGQTLAGPHGTTTGPSAPDSGVQAAQGGSSSSADGSEASNPSHAGDGHHSGADSQPGSSDGHSSGAEHAKEPGSADHGVADTPRPPPRHRIDGHTPPGGRLPQGGLTLTAKLVIGGALLAIGGGGVWVLGQGGQADAKPSVPLHVQVATDVFEVGAMPGTTEGTCRVEAGRTDCTKVVRVAKGEQGPVTVVPDGPLPTGVKIVYWGCDEGAASATCTVTADAERSVCVTTTSPKDTAARSRCAALGGTGKEASVPPWARILGVWTRQDGAKFDFDGANARWLPASREDLTVCRYTVDDPSGSTTITMTCQDLDSSRKATISLSAAGDIGNRDRTLTITGDPTLSGTYREEAPTASDTAPPSIAPSPILGDLNEASRPTFDPCSILKPSDLKRTAGYLAIATELDVRRNSDPGNSGAEFFGQCGYYTPPHTDNPATVEWSYQPGLSYSGGDECARIDITDKSWVCRVTKDSKEVRVQLADGASLQVRVGRQQEFDWIDDTAAAEALMKIILSRI
ncbi:ATP-binding protein [Streptomyces nigra]|uniref:ATP-binding protein n=1 Tax=Streptomyces nigra TaxID=1827580 RepID=UPI00380687D6